MSSRPVLLIDNFSHQEATQVFPPSQPLASHNAVLGASTMLSTEPGL